MKNLTKAALLQVLSFVLFLIAMIEVPDESKWLVTLVLSVEFSLISWGYFNLYKMGVES